jgi:hypothetical protein
MGQVTSKFSLWAVAALLVSGGAVGLRGDDNDTTDAEEVLARVTHDIKYLASDELEGRGPGTRGIDVAGDYVVEEFKRLGLVSGTSDGTYKQPFTINIGTDLQEKTTKLVLNAAGDEIALEFKQDFQPQQMGGTSHLAQVPLVFVGYGITAEEHNYDEYRDLDVAGKVVVILRREPQQSNEQSVFSGAENTEYARIQTKIDNALAHSAAGVILVNDSVSAPTADQDELMATDGFGQESRGLPLVHVKRAAIERLLEKSPLVLADGTQLKTLAEVEQRIDAHLEPLSQTFEGCTVTYEAEFVSRDANLFNVVGVVEGQGPLADETIVIGAHYDHLGYGGYGSRAPDQRGVIHNGADDNATGTAAVLELARRFAQADPPPARRLVFVAFSGEERGLLGSAHYVENPLFPLEKTVCMVNFDMIGWLRDSKLTIYGTGSATEFDALVDQAIGDTGVTLEKVPSAFAGSDHMPFYGKNMPVLFLHTGLTDTYHRPEDDFETINVPGAVQVINYSEAVVAALAAMPAKPTFVEGGAPARRRSSYLGVELDFENPQGVRSVVSVAENSPAAKAGIQQGDVILTIAGEEVSQRDKLLEILRDNEPGTKIEIRLKRGTEELTVEVELERSPRRRRSGGE